MPGAQSVGWAPVEPGAMGTPDKAESRTVTRTCTPEEAAALVRQRDTIGFGLGPGNPDGFLTALGGRDDWEDLVLGGALLLGYYTVLTKPGVSYRSGFFGPAERVLLAEGHDIELVPGGFRQFAPDARPICPTHHDRPGRTPRRRRKGAICRCIWGRPATN